MEINLIEKEIQKLEKLAEEIENLTIDIIDKIPLLYNPLKRTAGGDYVWGIPEKENKKYQRKAIRSYQLWYSSSQYFIKEYLKEREDEFNKGYGEILEFLKPSGRTYKAAKSGFIDNFINTFEIQRSILLSVPNKVKLDEFRLRKLISADFIDSELEQAEFLYKKKFYRAAGALAGVALEKHLQTLCQLNEVDYNRKETIDPLATKLYKRELLDLTEFKKIQHLASIRNDCDHPNEISSEKVEELINGVKKIV